MELEKEGTMTLRRPAQLCEFVGGGNGSKPTKPFSVEPGTYRVKRVKNPVAEGCLPWIVILDITDRIVGMAEDPLLKTGAELAI
ncbi:MAG: hypothetical protein WC619_03790 [Patescibacteria group bacterium]